MTMAPVFLLLVASHATVLGGVHETDPVRLRQAEAKYQWFSVPMEVAGLPFDAHRIPLSCPIDFRSLTQSLRVPGLVDEYSLRLFLVRSGGPSAEQPVQFTPLGQRRITGGHLLTGTSKQVSYTGEFRAGQTPDESQVAGQLAWLAEGSPGGKTHYRLDFGVVQAGSMVQVPYPPQNFRAFDEQRHALPVRWFPVMQLRPQQPLDGLINLFDGKELVTSYHTGPRLNEIKAGSFSFRRPFLDPVNGLEGISLRFKM